MRRQRCAKIFKHTYNSFTKTSAKYDQWKFPINRDQKTYGREPHNILHRNINRSGTDA